MDLKELASSNSTIRHPWESSRAQFFEQKVEQLFQESRPLNVLDVGSGDTWVAQSLLAKLPAGSKLDCVDMSFTPEQLTQFTNAEKSVTALTQIPENSKYDLISLLDVVEHIQDDRAFLKNLAENHLAEKGKILISVPSYQFLFTKHDEWLEHFRRYSPTEGRRLIADCGLSITDEGGLFHSLLYPRALGKLSEMIRRPNEVGGVSEWSHGGFVTNLILGVLNLDWKSTETLRKVGVQIPGLSWWCLCQKG